MSAYQWLVRFLARKFRLILVELAKAAVALAGRLLRFCQQAIADAEIIDVGPRKAAVGVRRRADDGLAAHVERGVDQRGAPGPPFELLEQLVEARIGLAMHRLQAGGVVDMGDGGQDRARYRQLLEPGQSLLFGFQRQPDLLGDRRREQHVWTRPVMLEVGAGAFGQNRWRERPERLATLDLQVYQ